MNPNRTNDLWCKTCKYHKCRCVHVGFDPAMLGGDRTVVWPIKRVTRDEFEKMYADDRPENQWPHGSLTTVPQYTRTMTMDDLRRNALESIVENLKERD